MYPARPPSPDYHAEPDQISDGGSAATEMFGDDEASQASNLPVSNLNHAFSEVAQAAAVVSQQSATPAPSQAALPAASTASTQAITTEVRSRDLDDDDLAVCEL